MKRLTIIVLMAFVLLAACGARSASTPHTIVVLEMLDNSLYQLPVDSVQDANRILHALESADDQKTVLVRNGQEVYFVISLRNLKYAFMTVVG